MVFATRRANFFGVPLAPVRGWMALLLLWSGGVKNETPANMTRRDVDLRQSLPNLDARHPANILL